MLGNPYTEVMVSGVASYGGTAGVPVVGQRYYTAFLVSVPGDPNGAPVNDSIAAPMDDCPPGAGVGSIPA